MNPLKTTLTGICLSLAVSTLASAKLQLPSFFSDKMVLQQKTKANIWGTADPGQKVVVSFSGQTVATTAGQDGSWKVVLKSLKTSKEGATLTITAGQDKKTINDVLVGEVWLASGQSNMEWTVQKTTSANSAKTHNDNLLRVYMSRNVTAITPATDFAGAWKTTRPGNTGGFTAVGYEFAKALREKLDVPVGIIECAWGGKPVQSFISDEAMKACPEAKNLLAQKAAAISKYNPAKAKAQYEKAVARWKTADAKWQEKKQGRRPRKPVLQMHPALNSRNPSSIYNGMIAPLRGYAARGAIWYQGESNAGGETAKNYGELLECLIQDWRKQWNSPLSFYYVQLANFQRNGQNSPGWVDVQDEMRRLLDDSNSKTGHIGMATINDIGHPSNIHPTNKIDVGQRLARWALNQDYGMKDVVVSGPLYKSHTIKGKTIEISFDHAKGLKSRDGKPLASFEIAGTDGNWKPATANISGDKVIVKSTEVSSPTQVRYAWKSHPPEANLINGEGLPTSCFITK